jgi:predicted GNAT family acetyltransferase
MSEEIKIVHLKSYGQRLETWLAMSHGDIVGHIYLEREEDNKIKFLDAWVHTDHRRKGIYRKLWDTRWEYVKRQYAGWKIYAWCKNGSLPLLVEKGFEAGETCTYVEKIIEHEEERRINQ